VLAYFFEQLPGNGEIAVAKSFTKSPKFVFEHQACLIRTPPFCSQTRKGDRGLHFPTEGGLHFSVLLRRTLSAFGTSRHFSTAR
jgi:hypothetical protein